MRWWRRLLTWSLALIAVPVSIGGGGGYVWLRSSLPVTAGEVAVAGVGAEVRITRDGNGVPYIAAASDADAAFGLGYVHAQDRLWQMEFQRRVGYGRLSEILGSTTLNTDRFLRTLGTGRAAESAWTALDADSQAILTAYAAGVNAYLAGNPQLPIEFTVLGFKPEPWQPTDSLVWAKMMSWDLGGNWADEILRATLEQQIGVDATAELLPAYTNDGPLILPPDQYTPPVAAASTSAAADGGAVDSQRALLTLWQELQQVTGLGGKLVGSNNWVLSGSRTTTGKPILANDPHLGTRIPSIWYLAGMQGATFGAVGATLPGLPAVVIGRNERIAWGVTNTGPDVQDLYIERVNARNEVEYNGSWEPLTLISETINVKDSDPVTLTVRISRHGPLISDVTPGTGDALAFRWTSLDEGDATLRAYLNINRADNWQQFRDALRDYRAPMQNFVFADVDGNIGYIAPGALPIRRNGDGMRPVPGWTDDYEWESYVDFDALPQVYNPPQGYIATANNQVVDDSYPYLMGTGWAAPYRAARIVEVIESRAQHSPADMQALQADVVSLQAREFLPVMLAITAADERAAAALALLADWDGTMAGDSAAAAIYQAYWQAVPQAVFADELRDLFDAEYAGERNYQVMALRDILSGDGSTWCDDVNTLSTTENCAETLSRALSTGLAVMAEQQASDDPAAWRWDRVHEVVFPHTPFSNVEPLRGLFERRIGNDGDGYTVDVAPIRAGDLYKQFNVPSYRQVIDLADPDSSQFMHTTGQSGNVLSSNYSDLLSRWQQVAYLPMTFTSSGNQLLRLLPER
jgi:penicillin G amidase